MTAVDKRLMSRERLLRLLTDGVPAGEAETYACAAGGLPAGIRLPPAVASAADGSATGAFVFASSAVAHVVLPPFPVEDELHADGWQVSPLRELLYRPRRVAVLLLRLGGYAAGVYEDGALVSSKVGARFVKGRHAKGGSSQARFARRRDEQAKALYRKACGVLRDQLDSAPAVDHFLVGGDRLTLAAFEKDCALLERLESVRLRRVLRVAEPKRAALETLPAQLYESVVLTARP